MGGNKRDILSSLYSRSRRAHSHDGAELWSAISPQASSSSVKSNHSVKLGKAHSSAPHTHSQSPQPVARQPPLAKHVVDFKIKLETPPAIMYGAPETSTGALISGICDVDLSSSGGVDGVVSLLDVSMSIVQEITYTLPATVAKQFPSVHKRNVLATWDILQHPHILASKKFSYPFSHLLPGTLPPTTVTPLFKVEYFIYAAATTKDMKRSEYSLKMPIGRSVISVGEKTSLRIFPPTDLSLSLVVPSAMFPHASVPAELRVEGLVSPPDEDAHKATHPKYKRWILKRITCRVDELVKVKWGNSEEEEFEHKQTLSYSVHKTGWKTDFGLQKGHIEFFTADFCPGALKRATKDLTDPISGLSVSHQLVCELLIAEETLSDPKAAHGLLTGAARVLRMQFAFPVVDRPGLGISWDDEVPPVYADIPLSPPQYDEVQGLPSVEDISATSLVFSPSLSPTMSPTLRHVDPHIRGFEHHPSPGLFPVHSSNVGIRSSPLQHPTTTLRPSSSHPAHSSSGSTNGSSSVSSQSSSSFQEFPQPPPKIKHKQH